MPQAMHNLKKIYEAGILVTLGTDSGATPIRIQGFSEHMELALMVQAGLTPIQAITVATLSAAKLLQIEDQYGALTAEKKADLILLEKVPSRDIHNTEPFAAFRRMATRLATAARCRHLRNAEIASRKRWRRDQRKQLGFRIGAERIGESDVAEGKTRRHSDPVVA